MRLKDCEQIWHGFGVLHRHFLLMMDFDCLLAICHKKGEYILSTFLESFVFVIVFWRRVFFLLVGTCGVV